MTYDPHLIRKEFPIFSSPEAPAAYLDNAATTHKPRSVIDGISAFYKEEYATIHRGIYTQAARAAERYAGVREKVAHFIGAETPEEIVFVRSTTEGINLIAHTFPRAFMQEGDEILLTEIEHHANIIPWQMVAKERGLKIKYVPLKEGAIDMDAFRELLTDRVKIVSVTHISNVTGNLSPVKEIVQLAHQKGAKVLIDGAQAAGHIDIDVTEIDADFYVFSGHKMYGPTGIGILYGKFSLLEQLPPFQTGGDMIAKVSLEETSFQPPPTRFEPGTPLIAEVIGLGHAIDYLSALGIEQIQSWEQHVTQLAYQELSKIPGLSILGSEKCERGALLSFVVEGCHPLDLATLLNLRGIALRSGALCAEPGVRALGYSAVMRASFGLYTLPEEIALLSNALHESLVLL